MLQQSVMVNNTFSRVLYKLILVPLYSYLQETLRVKDEELQQLAKDIRARDSTIREIADKLTETAESAEAAASAAHAMDEERRLLCAEIERLKIDSGKQIESFMLKVTINFDYFG